MKKRSLLMIGLLLIIGDAMAEMAAATFRAADEGQKIQVIIDKKIINSEPKNVVKIKGAGGVHQVKIRVFNGPKQFSTKEQLRIRVGYKNEFIVFLNPDRSLEVKRTRATKLYNSQYKRPDRFYNRRFYAHIKSQQKKTGRTRDPQLDYQNHYLAQKAIIDKQLLYTKKRSTADTC